MSLRVFGEVRSVAKQSYESKGWRYERVAKPQGVCTSLCHTGTEVTLVTKQHTVVLPLQVYVTRRPFFDTKKVFYEVLDFKNVFFTKN